jgi:hypothetical protein
MVLSNSNSNIINYADLLFIQDCEFLLALILNYSSNK